MGYLRYRRLNDDGTAAEDFWPPELIAAKLERGELAPSDLVLSARLGRWCTFAESPEFFEQCESLDDPRAAKRARLGSWAPAAAMLFALAYLLWLVQL